MIDPKTASAVLSAVDRLRIDLVQLISGAVQIPSVNPTFPGTGPREVGGETQVNEFLRPVMESIGLETDLFEIEKGRGNLVGRLRGSGGGRSLVFNGHVDVVPAESENLWTVAGPWSGKVVGERIYGRGSTDMKGGIAAAITAVRALVDAGIRPKGDVLLEAVAGEELMNTSIGTGAVLARGYRADAGIVAEPSAPPYQLGLMVAAPGCLLLTVRIKGKATHSSMRDELIRDGGRGAAVGVSAIDKGFLVYQGLLNLEREWGQTKRHPAFTRPGHFTICPATFRGGEAIGFIPEDCAIEYVVWFPPQDDPKQVKREIEEHVARVAQTDSWLREHPPVADWWDFLWPPYDVPADAPICRAVSAAYEIALGAPARTYGFAAVDDASFLNLAGIPTISVGPGDIERAHAPNEYIEIQEAVDAAKVYALTILEWCGY